MNYFFCFRWILIAFKREFSYPQLARFWEALWSRHRGEKLHLLCVVALLRRHRAEIIDGALEFDTLLQFVNQLTGKIDVEQTLWDAEQLHEAAAALGCI